MSRTCTRVAAAIIVRDGKLFSAQRGHGSMKGGWEFPGGKIEPGETAEQACRREVFEELGIEIDVGELFAHVSYDYNAFKLSMDCFVCTISKGEPVLGEHLAMRWLARDELSSVSWLPADVSIIESIRASDLLSS